MMNSEIGFCRKVLSVFEDNGISIEHMPSGIDTMTVFVHQDEFVEKEQKVLAQIHKAVNPDSSGVAYPKRVIGVFKPSPIAYKPCMLTGNLPFASIPPNNSSAAYS